MRPTCLLLDLDGTLIDSGIRRAVGIGGRRRIGRQARPLVDLLAATAGRAN